MCEFVKVNIPGSRTRLSAYPKFSVSVSSVAANLLGIPATESVEAAVPCARIWLVVSTHFKHIWGPSQVKVEKPPTMCGNVLELYHINICLC